MKIKALVATLVFGLTMTNLSQANDINMSWSMQALQAQALTQTVKQAKLLKYSKSATMRSKQTYTENEQFKGPKQSTTRHTRP